MKVDGIHTLKGSQLLKYSGYSSIVSNFVQFKTREYNLDEDGNDTSLFFTDDNSGATKVTAEINCNFFVTLNVRASTVVGAYLRRYNSSDVLVESWYIGHSNSAEDSEGNAVVFRMNAGDYITIYNTNALNDVVEQTFLIVKATPTLY